MLFPGLDPQKAWAIASTISERSKYDDRMVDVEIYHEDENSAYFYMKGKKPPVPLFAQRENIVELFKIPNGAGEGRNLICGLNRTHPNKPVGTGFFDLVRMFIHF